MVHPECINRPWFVFSRRAIFRKPDPSLALRHLLSPEQNACESNGVQYHKQDSEDL
jgi:hypothetical protein